MPVRDLKGKTKYVVMTISFIATVYNVITLAFIPYEIYSHSILNLLVALPIVFLAYSSGKKDTNYIPWYDYTLAALASIPPLILYFNIYEWLYFRAWLVSSLRMEHIILSGIFTITLLEAVRRVAGSTIFYLIIFFIIYLLIGPYLPSPLTHRGLRIERIFELIYISPYATLSTPLQTMTTYVIAFTTMGAIFSAVGVSAFFIDIAKASVGRFIGGAAKADCIASSLFGTISGSAVANVYATGVILVPAMKKCGFPSHIAAAVEATSSTGGQIMPPVMGAAAFVMADLLGVPYAKVMIAAIIPALLYYLGAYVQIHLMSLRLGIRPLLPEERPNFKKTLYIGWPYLIVLYALIYLIAVAMWHPARAALTSMFIAMVLSFVKRSDMLTPKKLYEAFSKAYLETSSLIVIAAGAGIIAGSALYSGLAYTFDIILKGLAGENTLMAVLLAAIFALILGMGMPTTAAYIVAASIAGVALTTAYNVEAFIAHFIIFYYAVISAITPPVALAAYAAASISGSDYFTTGLYATKLAFSALVVPLLLLYKPDLLLGYKEFTINALLHVLTAIIGVVGLAYSFEGPPIKNSRSYIAIITRVVAFVGSLICLLSTQLLVEVIGLIIVIVTLTTATIKFKFGIVG